jgi:hypothetical protein
MLVLASAGNPMTSPAANIPLVVVSKRSSTAIRPRASAVSRGRQVQPVGVRLPPGSDEERVASMVPPDARAI